MIYSCWDKKVIIRLEFTSLSIICTCVKFSVRFHEDTNSSLYSEVSVNKVRWNEINVFILQGQVNFKGIPMEASFSPDSQFVFSGEYCLVYVVKFDLYLIEIQTLDVFNLYI